MDWRSLVILYLLTTALQYYTLYGDDLFLLLHYVCKFCCEKQESENGVIWICCEKQESENDVWHVQDVPEKTATKYSAA